MISQATNRLPSSPTGVESMLYLLGLDSNISHKKCQSLETDRTVVCQLLIPLVLYRGSLHGVKRSEREVVYSPPFGDEVENEWSHTSTPAICPYDTDRDNFTFLPFTLGCLFEYSVLFVPIPLHVSSSKLCCLICNIFTHAISNTGYECRINVSYETTNWKHRRKKQSLSILGIFPAFTWMDWVKAWRKSEFLLSLSTFEPETSGIQVRRDNVWTA